MGSGFCVLFLFLPVDPPVFTGVMDDAHYSRARFFQKYRDRRPKIKSGKPEILAELALRI